MVLIDSPSAGSCLIPASLEPVQNSFLHREMGDSDGCRGNRDRAKPFPFSANGGGGICNRGRHKVIHKHSGGAHYSEGTRLLVTLLKK